MLIFGQQQQSLFVLSLALELITENIDNKIRRLDAWRNHRG